MAIQLVAYDRHNTPIKRVFISDKQEHQNLQVPQDFEKVIELIFSNNVGGFSLPTRTERIVVEPLMNS